MYENKAMQKKTSNRKGVLSKWLNKARLRACVMALALASMLSISAFATDGTGNTSTSGFSAVWGSFDDLGTLMTKVWSMMTSNPLLTIMLAVLLLAIGCRVVRMLMKTARGH